MANTVNDVMNVIASPDYGIKNIAGTNQEILAILEGTHNSKNNIHTIVDDIKYLLQNLVIATTVKKSIEVNGGNAPKINHKHIQNILDETKGIKRAIDNLAKAILKQGGGTSMPAVAKLSNKASDKVAEAMIKSMSKEKKGGGLSAIIDAFTKLKDISLKDIIFGNLKIKRIKKLFKNAQKDLNIKEKDLNVIIKLINATPEMMKALKKVGWRINRILKKNIVGKLKELLFGKNSLLELSKLLQKHKKTFDNASKASKNIKDFATSLNKAMKELIFASFWSKFAGGGIKSLEKMIDNIIPLSKKLIKNKKSIEASAKAAKKITTLVGNLLVTSIFLTIATITALPAILGAMILKVMVDMIIPVAKKLARSQKHLAKATASALLLTAFTGLMLITSFFLSKIGENGLSTLWGSIVILGVVVLNIFTFKMLGKAMKNIIMGAISMAIMSISLLLFGIALGKITQATKDVTWKQFGMIAALTGLFGVVVAILGIPAVSPFILLGAISLAAMSLGLLIFGIALGKIAQATEKLEWKQIFMVSGSILAFGIPTAVIGLLIAPIALGSIAMIVMSLGLLLFSSALSQITKATENLELSQLLIISGSILALGITTSIIGLLVAPIALGSGALLVMSLGLIPFSAALGKISQAGEKLTFGQIGIVAGAMGIFAAAISGLAILSIPVGLGSAVLAAMAKTLYDFVKTLKMIKDMGGVPKGEVDQVLNAMGDVGKFFSKNALSFKTKRSAKRYAEIMKPFIKTAKYFGKLKELGSIPLELVNQTLNAMSAIGNYYTNNPIDDDVIDQAEIYEDMMKPFGKTIKYLDKLKKMGGIPLGLVYQTLNAMSAIANYYINNPIDDDVIDQAEIYEDMMKPFGKTIKYLAKLKEMGSIPLGLVYQTLNAMSAIANYYLNNPIEKEVIKQAKRYKKMMKPFGKTIEHFNSLNELGSIPMKLVFQTLDSMGIIANYYLNNPIDDDVIDQAENYKDMMEPFGGTIDYMFKLKDLGTISTEAVKSVVTSLYYISWFYKKVIISDNIEEKTEFIKIVVENFTDMAGKIQDKFANMKEIDIKPVISIANTCSYILKFYEYTDFSIKLSKVNKMNYAVKSFIKTANEIKSKINGFNENDCETISFALKGMRKIVRFLRWRSLGPLARIRAKRTIKILQDMTSVMVDMSKINPSNISSVGNALSTTLDGIESIDMSKVEAVTNMFNAFKGINKSENILNKFTESVNKFTDACNNLMNAMGLNTDAINNMDGNNNAGNPFINNMGGGAMNSVIETTTADDGSEAKGIRISNVDEIARNIADKINGAFSLDIPDTQIQLLINGSGGNEWVITRY